jgi:competence protein ComEA
LPAGSWRIIGGLALAAFLGLAAFTVAASAPSGEVSIDGGAAWSASASLSAVAGGDPSAAGTFVVDVQGAVLQPGVIRLAVGSRVGDAIAKAGGYSPRVDAERAARELNLATEIQDGDRIIVPSRDDPPGSPANGGTAPGTGADPGGASDGLIDLNTASASELDGLPGVGPVTAQKIIDARAEKPFASIEELRDRKVVGPATFEKLRDLVTVR